METYGYSTSCNQTWLAGKSLIKIEGMQAMFDYSWDDGGGSLVMFDSRTTSRVKWWHAAHASLVLMNATFQKTWLSAFPKSTVELHYLVRSSFREGALPKLQQRQATFS